MTLSIYTDGSSLGNPGRGGWAYLIVNDKDVIIDEDSGHFNNVTNGRMEVFAFARGLVEGLSNPSATAINIYSDSQYVVNSVEKGWAENWVKTQQSSRPNFDLWKNIVTWLDYARKRNITLKVHWVKGHATNQYNNRVDELARKRASEL